MTKRLTSINQQLRESPEILPLIIGVVILLVQSIQHLGLSLWLDETITAWVVKDGLGDLANRAMEYQGQSPFYFVGPWIITKALGFHEWTLRLPSLISNLVTVVTLYQLFGNLTGRAVAIYGAAMFAIMASCSPQLQSARPYALAVCCFSLSLLFLVRWALTARWSLMLCFALSTSAVLYAHYLFGLGFPLFLVVLVFLGKRSLIGVKQLLGATALCGILTLPAGWQLRLVASKAKLYSFDSEPSFALWTEIISLDRSTICIVLIVAFLWLGKLALRASEAHQYGAALLLALCLWGYPSMVLAAVSIITSTSVFVQRYGLYSVIGESLLQGLALCSIVSQKLRKFVFLAASVIAILYSSSRSFLEEDWRTALNELPKTPSEPSVALVWTGLIETKDPSWVLDDRKREYLLAPTSIYPVAMKTSLLPLDPAKLPQESVFTDKDRALIDGAKRLFIVIRSFSPCMIRFERENNSVLLPWRAPNQSFRIRSSKTYSGISVLELERIENKP